VVPSVSLADNGKQYRRWATNSSDLTVSRTATLTVLASTSRNLALLAGGLGGSGSTTDRLAGRTSVSASRAGCRRTRRAMSTSVNPTRSSKSIQPAAR
jgi:hypothetical protein